MPTTLEGRRLLFETQQALTQGQLDSNDPKRPDAKQLFEQGFHAWQKSLAKFPTMEEDIYDIGEYLAEALKLYRKQYLGGGPFPADFPLQRIIERMDNPDQNPQ